MSSKRIALVLALAAGLLGCGSSDHEENGAADGAAARSKAMTAPSGEAAEEIARAHADPLPGGRVQGFPQPSTPAVDVVRKQRSVVIRFQFPPVESEEAKPWMLLTSVDSAGDEIPPLTLRTPVSRERTGVVHQPLGEGRPPFELLVSTLASNGLRSKIVRIPLPE